MTAYGVYDSHCAITGDHAGSFDDAVLGSLVNDEIVVTAAAADLYDLCRCVTVVAGNALLCKVRSLSFVCSDLLILGELQPQFEVLLCQLIVGLGEGKIVLDFLRAAPYGSHECMRTLRDPDILELSVVPEHIQRSYLQEYEDSCIDQEWYDAAFAHFISSRKNNCQCS